MHFALAYSRDLPVYESFYVFADGRASGPSQSRILMALLFHWALKVKSFVAFSHHLPFPYNDPLSFMMVVITAVSIFVAAEAVRIAARSLGISDDLTRFGAFSVLLMAYFNYILTSEVRTQTAFDVPQVAFFAVCFAALLMRRYLLFVVVFAVATLNRESTCFLIPVAGLLAINDQEQPKHPAKVLTGLLILCGIWMPLRYFTLHFFSDATHLFDLHWRLNVRTLVNPLHWATLMSVFAFFWIPYVAYFDRIRHRGLQWCAVLFPFWAILMFLVGDLLEIRIHGEWTAYVALCLLLIVADVTGQRFVATEPAR